METRKRQHNALSLATKVKIIQELDRNDLSKTEIAKKFNIPKSTLSRILKNKGKIDEARYFEYDGGTEFLPSLSAMHSCFVRKCLNKAKQTVITSFFPSQ
ncbi:hypothetical protein MTO96_018628 [Rhipicephalus appendiculatus]